MRAAPPLLLLGCLYLAQGLPYGFFTQALPVLLREMGLSLKAISATSLLFLPWALKFLWAPAVDHYGTRRQWLLPLQLSAVAVSLLLSFIDMTESLLPVLAALFVFNLVAATQDIATDGLAVRMLDARRRGLANGLQVGGYRIGMVIGGGALLALYAAAGWQAMCVAMAALLLLATVPVWTLREPAHGTPHEAAPHVATEWARRLRVPGMAAFVVLICFYKLGDSMIATLAGPFMKDSGVTTTQIAWIKGTLGSTMGLAGAAIGGWLAWKLGRRAALLACGLLQAASLALYVAAAYGVGGPGMIYAASTAEHLLGGMATVALFTLMMDASDPEHAGTDYTLLACAIVIATGLAQFLGAVIADAAGYGPMFSIGFALSIAGCLALVRAIDRGTGPARLRDTWPAPAATIRA